MTLLIVIWYLVIVGFAAFVGAATPYGFYVGLAGVSLAILTCVYSLATDKGGGGFLPFLFILTIPLFACGCISTVAAVVRLFMAGFAL